MEKKKTAAKRKMHGGRVGYNQAMRKRLQLLTGAMAMAFLVVICGLAWYQLINYEFWQSKAINQQLTDVEIPAKRGTICDVNGEKLVQSVTAWTVTVNPNSIPQERYDMVADKLAEATGNSRTYIDNRLAIDGNVVKLRGKMDMDHKDALEEFIVSCNEEMKIATDERNELAKASAEAAGTKYEPEVPDRIDVICLTDTRRTYAMGSLASTLLGFTGTDNTGSVGLEAQYDSVLSGVPGRAVYSSNANSDAMPFEKNTMVDAKDGNNIVLTIDANVQQILEKNLRQAVIENDVRNRACGIIINVNTGAVLAMATMPDYDPADPYTLVSKSEDSRISAIADEKKQADERSKAQFAQWSNKVIGESYEPGSVFKPVTMAAALEEGLTNENETFNCPGYRYVGGRKIGCHRSGGHGTESLMQGMMNSCNPVFMTLGERLGGTKFFKYYQAFGFTELTGIDLPGEGVGVYHSAEDLNKHAADLAVSSFGQTNTVTPIQMITAISAVCNGGYLVKPYVVSQVRDSDDNIISSNETKIKRQVISENTSELINRMLEATVSNGTAKNGYVAGYRIGGKTGTSEKIAETAKTGIREYVASYCAIAPSDSPEIAMLVMLDEPHGASHMGGAIAAPVVRRTLSEVLPYLGIETIYSSSDVKILDTITPNLMGKPLPEAKALLGEKGLKIRVIGDGDTVTGQIPQSGQSIPKDGTVVVSTDDGGEVPLAKVPDVKGMSPSEANDVIVSARLNIRYSGSGYDSSRGEAVSQSIPSGTEVEQGTVITVEFLMGGATD